MKTQFFLVFAIVLTPRLLGQTSNTNFTSRADLIQSERMEKASNIHPGEGKPVENYFDRIDRVIRRVPIRLGVGGLGPGAGIEVNSAIGWSDSADQVHLNLWGTGWIHRFYSAGTSLQLTDTMTRGVTLSVEGLHSDAPQLEYYGSGPNSSIHDQTSFRREDTFFAVREELNANRRLVQSCRLGQLLLNVGPGQNESLPSTETVFGPAEAPGIDVQSNFLIAGCSAGIELRDFKDDPHKGTYAVVTYDRYQAQKDRRFSYHRLSAFAEHYVPLLNEKRVIAIRAKTDLSFHSTDQVVPFYLQSTLGSDSDLRGFRRYRFYDENSLTFTGEYRWEINTGFDMALFADFGKVFHRPGEISLSEMENSTGFGLRFKRNRSVFARLDTGFSHEGVQVWLKFGKLF